MQKQIIRKILIFAAAGLILIIAITFGLQSIILRTTADDTAATVLSQISNKIEENNASIVALKSSLDKEYIEKARAFAHMLKLNPDIIDDMDALNEIKEQLGVEELHVTDDKGVLLWGTVPDFYGFDFNTSEQAKPFMPIIDDPSIEIAQEPTPSGTTGKLFQYVSVTRQDAKGIVQIGMSPTRLDETLEATNIQNVLKSFSVGTNGFTFAINTEDGTVAAFTDASKLGAPAADIGINDLSSVNGFLTTNGKAYYYNAKQIDKYTIYTALPTVELYSQRVIMAGISLVLFGIVFAALVILINVVLRSTILNSFDNIVAKVKEIAGGNLDAIVDVRTSEEFAALSDGINDMVSNIKDKIDEANILAAEQSELIEKIGSTAGAINNYSDSMSNISKTISDGASMQAQTVAQLSNSFELICKQVNDNTAAAHNASEIANDSKKQLEYGISKLEQMNKSMADISDASRNIGQVIKTVSDIAFQTNILALNASVEAARAGVHGKGFSVVANEVRNLANKTSAAANSTTSLIESALNTVDNGKAIAADTSKAITEIIESTKKSADIMNTISQATENQAESIAHVTSGINMISDVIQENVRTSSDAEITAGKLNEQAEVLNELVSKS